MHMVRSMGTGSGLNKKVIYGGLCGLAVICLLAWMILPKLRSAMLIIFGSLIGSILIVALFQMAFKSLGSKKVLSSFGADEPPAKSGISISPKSVRAAGQSVLQAVRHAREQFVADGLRKIGWSEFEKLVGLIYEHRGFSVARLDGTTSNAGADLLLKSTTEEIIVQCKQWRDQVVGVGQIKEFLVALKEHKITKGIFVTLAGSTGDAGQLADKHGIKIFKETDIIEMLGESGLIYSKEISDLFSGETKSCPQCRQEMVLRTAYTTGKKFWGCSTYPTCSCTVDFQGQ